MSLLIPALVGGVIAMALALSVKPIETMLRLRRHARRRDWWRRRRKAETAAYERQRARRRTAHAALG